MKYIVEVARIVESSLASDRRRLIAYVEQLVKKLKKDSDIEASKILDQLLKTSILNYQGSSVVGSFVPSVVDGMPRDKETKFDLADIENVSSDSVHVFLSKQVQDSLEEFVAVAKNSKRLEAYGVKSTPSLLLYGLPGLGKTETARYLASKLGQPLVTVRMDSLISSFLGNTAKNIRAIFDYAKTHPCVLFLDEFDAIAKRRDDGNELGELKRVVIGLLQNVDNLNGELVLVAATNHEHLLDRAVWRRFSYKIALSLPVYDVRKKMFQTFLAGFADAHISYDLLSSLSEGLTGAAIRSVCSRAIRRMVIENMSMIDESSLQRSCVEEVIDNPSFAFNVKSDPDLDIFLNKYGKEHLNLRAIAKIFNTSLSTISRRIKDRSKRYAQHAE